VNAGNAAEADCGRIQGSETEDSGRWKSMINQADAILEDIIDQPVRTPVPANADAMLSYAQATSIAH